MIVQTRKKQKFYYSDYYQSNFEGTTKSQISDDDDYHITKPFVNSNYAIKLDDIEFNKSENSAYSS